MQFLHHNLARDSGDPFPMVPGLLKTMRHEFGSSVPRQSATAATRATPPPAPSPLAPSRPTQSVADILTAKRRAPSARSGTILTRDSGDTYGTGRRTVLGTPIA